MAALALCRFARDGAALLLWGTCVYLAAVAPGSLRATLSGRLAPLRDAAALVAGVAVLLSLPVEAASLGDGWADALDPATVRALLLDTTVGTAWIAQGAATALLLLVALLPRDRRDRANSGCAALLLASLTLTGHAAMHEGWLGAAHRANHLVHVLAAGFWLGALPPLLQTLATLGTQVQHRDAVLALRRFSLLGHGAVALVIMTGLVNTALILGGWPTGWPSPYLSLLVLKGLLVATMAGLALFNRYAVVPRMQSRPEAAVRVLRAATLAEIGLGFAAVALVAVFGLLEPS